MMIERDRQPCIATDSVERAPHFEMIQLPRPNEFPGFFSIREEVFTIQGDNQIHYLSITVTSPHLFNRNIGYEIAADFHIINIQQYDVGIPR